MQLSFTLKFIRSGIQVVTVVETSLQHFTPESSQQFFEWIVTLDWTCNLERIFFFKWNTWNNSKRFTYKERSHKQRILYSMYSLDLVSGESFWFLDLRRTLGGKMFHKKIRHFSLKRCKLYTFPSNIYIVLVIFVRLTVCKELRDISP